MIGFVQHARVKRLIIDTIFGFFHEPTINLNFLTESFNNCLFSKYNKDN